MLLVAPAITAAQTAPPHSSDALPFGRWTIVDHKRDDSAIVWSRCLQADGGPGRWVQVQPLEVVRPTYFVQNALLNKALVPPLVECLGNNGLPGHPEPALPANALILPGSRISYQSTVQVERYDATQRQTKSYGFPVGGEAAAYDDVGGPVVVTTSEIEAFPPTFRLVANGDSMLTIRRPEQALARPASHCTVRFTDELRSVVIAKRDSACTALSKEERDHLVAEARATIGETKRR